MAAPLSVVVWKWRPAPGADPDRIYTAEHVNRMRSMLERHLHVPHQLVCITDDAANLDPRIRYIWLDDATGFKHCRRLRIFDPEMVKILGHRIVQLDLDIVIVGDVTEILAPAEPGSFMYSGNNISVMAFQAGCPHGLWAWWDVDRAHALALAQGWAKNPRLSDQAVVNYYLKVVRPQAKRTKLAPGLTMYPYRSGVTSVELHHTTRMVHMYGKITNPANHALQAANPWIVEHWK